MPQTLPTAISTFVGPEVSRRIGTVTVVSGTTVTVSVGGASIVVDGYLASYSPVVDDIVFLLREDSSWVLLGQIIGPS
ncbi:MAG: hypothetical protein EHM35_05990 [Planctomycetaceae bacterium]|nr:MAG: hypothetical protein EHM35_05990 [Planctomycetaceae bacterium]